MPRPSHVALVAVAALALGGCGGRALAPDSPPAPTGQRSPAAERPTALDAPGETPGQPAPTTCEPAGPGSGRQKLGPCINAPRRQVLRRLSPDGRRLYFARLASPDGRAEGGFSFVRRRGSAWTAPKPLAIDRWHTREPWVSASLSASGGVMVLHAVRDDGLGGADLYAAFRPEDGTWSEPVNLGPDVNTPGDEITPYLAADGVTLYFSSAARGGLGFFASIGVRLTESSVKSAAASWRDRLER
mgnify:CR=1 FL=1|jgi:hypothetical protein